MTIFRNILALVLGVIAGSAVNMGVVMVAPLVVPPPAGVNMADAASLAASAHLLEPKHFLFPFLAHALGTLVGALVAFLVAARAAMAYIVGVIFLAGGIAASMMIPAPAWFIALDLVVAYLPMAALGVMLGRRFAPEAHSYS